MFDIKTYTNKVINKLGETGFFHIMGSNVINKVLAFLNSVVILRLVTKSEYGIYTSALNIYSICMILSGMGIVGGILQVGSEYAKNKEKNYKIFRYGINFGIKINILLAIVIIIVAIVMPLPIEESRSLLLLMSLLPILQIIVDTKKTYYRTKLDNHMFSYLNVMNAFLIFVFSLVGAYFYQTKGFVIGQYVALIITILLIIRKSEVKPSIKSVSLEKEDKTSLFKISFISMLNNGLSNILYLADIFIIGLLISQSDILAEYKVAITLPTALVFIPLSVCTYIYSYFSMNKNNKVWLKKHFKTTIFAMASLNFTITLFLVVFAPIIIKIMFGTQYLSAVTLFRLSSVSYFFIGTFRVISGNLLITQRKLIFNLIVSIIAGLLNIILNLILVKYLGAIGALYTTLGIAIFTGLVSTSYYWVVINKVSEDEKI